MKTLTLLFFSLTFGLISHAQELKFYYNDNGELTIPEIATHYRVGKLDPAIGHFVETVKEFRLDGSLLSTLTYDSKGMLQEFYINDSTGKKTVEFNSTKDKYNKLDEGIRTMLENKFALKQAEYIRKRDYQEFRKLLTNLPGKSHYDSLIAKEAIEIYSVTDLAPTFPGGRSKMFGFIDSNLVYPDEARNKHISGKVYVQFVILPDGSLTNFQVIRGLGHGCDEAAVNAIAKLPDWKPGIQRDEPVACQMILPITFEEQNQ